MVETNSPLANWKISPNARQHIPSHYSPKAGPLFHHSHLNMTYRSTRPHSADRIIQKPAMLKAHQEVRHSDGRKQLGLLNNVQQRSGWKEEFVLEGRKQWGRQWWGGPITPQPLMIGANHVQGSIIVSCYQGKYWVAWVDNNTLATTGRWRWMGGGGELAWIGG